MVQIDVVPVIGTDPGSITLTASGGTAPYQYSIDNGATLQDSTGVFRQPGGRYLSGLCEDTNGCIFTQDVNLVVNALHVNVTKQDISCYGVADGNFLLTTVDGVAPYTLTGSWLTDPYISADGLISFTGQTAGIYDIWITTAKVALFIDTIEIVEPAEILATALITNATCSAVTTTVPLTSPLPVAPATLTFNWSQRRYNPGS